MKEFTFIVTPENGKKRRVVIEAESMAEAMDELQAPKGADIDVESVKKVEGDGDASSDSDKSNDNSGDSSGDSEGEPGGDSGDTSGDETDENDDDATDDSEHVEDDGSKDDEPERGHWWDGDWDRRRKRKSGGE